MKRIRQVHSFVQAFCWQALSPWATWHRRRRCTVTWTGNAVTARGARPATGARAKCQAGDVCIPTFTTAKRGGA